MLKKKMSCKSFGGPVKLGFSMWSPVLWSDKGPQFFPMSVRRRSKCIFIACKVMGMSGVYGHIYTNANWVGLRVQEHFPQGSTVYTGAGPHTISICGGPISRHQSSRKDFVRRKIWMSNLGKFHVSHFGWYPKIGTKTVQTWNENGRRRRFLRQPFWLMWL